MFWQVHTAVFCTLWGIDMKGNFVRKSLVLAVSALSYTGSALAQQETGTADEALEEVYVLGSRVPGRSAEKSAVPVDVLTGADLLQSGTIGGEIGSLLEANIPSFNMTRQSNSDQGDIVRAAQL